MKIVTRQEAVEKGLMKYFTGKPCRKGHLAERSTIVGDCTVCTSNRQKEYRRLVAENRKKAQEKLDIKNNKG